LGRESFRGDGLARGLDFAGRLQLPAFVKRGYGSSLERRRRGQQRQQQRRDLSAHTHPRFFWDSEGGKPVFNRFNKENINPDGQAVKDGFQENRGNCLLPASAREGLGLNRPRKNWDLG
jgi:hypothetical protein